MAGKREDSQSKRIILVNPPVHFIEGNTDNAYSLPYGLLKVGAYLKDKGHKLKLIDCMYYDNIFNHPLVEVGELKCGNYENEKRTKKMRHFGKTYDEFRKELKSHEEPDEIYVSCCITHNWRPAHKVIEICKEVYPNAKVIFGGVYPTLCPEHAKKSKADEVFSGNFHDAYKFVPAYDLMGKKPDYAMTYFTKGCPNKCDYCAFYIIDGIKMWAKSVEEAISEIKEIREVYGMRKFLLSDANLLAFGDYFEKILDEVIKQNIDIELWMHPPLQSNLVTYSLCEKMVYLKAKFNCISLVSADKKIMKEKFGKPHYLPSVKKIVGYLKKLGIPENEVHLEMVAGIPDIPLESVVDTIVAIWELGCRASILVYDLIPKTKDYFKYAHLVKDKSLEEMHAELFPLANPNMTVSDMEALLLTQKTTKEEGIKIVDSMKNKKIKAMFKNRMKEKRVDIKTGFICNNNCRFCVQADNKLKGNRNLEEIKKDLEESRKRCKGVVLTGGEVAIRKDFFEIVKYAKELGYKTIQIQTNGRMFSSLDFCKKTIEAGATEFSPALHGYCKEQHDYLTRAKGSFSQTVKGIQNLKSLGAYVLTNTVVVKSNYRNLPEIAKLLVKLGVDQFQFAFVHPMGNAWKNFDNIVPWISLAAPYIHKGLQIGINAGKKVMAEAMPYCFMKGYENYIAERVIPETEIKGIKNQNTNNFTKERRIYGKAKFTQCKECLYNFACEGPWSEYPKIRGNSEFNPRKK